MPPRTPRGRRPARTPRFEDTLVLQAFLADRLGGNPLDPNPEEPTHAIAKVPPGANATGPSPFLEAFLALRGAFLPAVACSREELVDYDRDLATLTEALNARRPGDPIRWQYFQWVSLMLSAIYLDMYHADPEGLREALNAHLAEFNGKRELALPEYTAEDLRRFSLWLATGAGKTLLLHANLLQFRHYANKHGARLPDHTIVLVPNEALAKQHCDELRAADIPAQVYAKGDEGDLRAAGKVRVLVITNILDPEGRADGRKRAKEGEVMYDPARFGSRNLVFVDEGHRGQSDDGVWRRVRRYLGADGFTFEYSATFKEVARPGLAALTEAVGDTPDAGPSAMAREYARSIAVDYAFKRFHADGYGKHYRVLTLATAGTDTSAAMDTYLTGCLLAFYEQLLVFGESPALAAEHRIERPLAVFAGLQVKGPDSEVFQSLSLFGRFLTDAARFVPILRNLVTETTEIRTRKGANVFKGMFREARRVNGDDGAALYRGIVREVFLAEAPGPLRVARRKDASGELQLRVGEGEPFGVVNVGEEGNVTKELAKPAHQRWAQLEPDITGGSLFESLPKRDCRLTVLVGSRKFMEGWNCFRVSMLGINRIGQGAGTQIIQLFGRGVRLRGKDGSLKRTSIDTRREVAGHPIERLRVLETISLFTVNADYLATFDEDVNSALTDGPTVEPVTVDIPIVADKEPPKLRVLRLPPGDRFVEQGLVHIGPGAKPAADGRLPTVEVKLDYYPKAGARVSKGAAADELKAAEFAITRPPAGFALLDHDALYVQLVRYKNEKRWHNLKLPRFVDVGTRRVPLTEWMFEQENWFRVSLERRLVDLDAMQDFAWLPLWQRLATELARGYVDAVYTWHRRAWQSMNAKVCWWSELSAEEQRELVPEGLWTEDGARHSVTVNVRDDDRGASDAVVAFVKDIAAEVSRGVYDTSKKHGLRSMGVSRSLWRPLLGLDDKPPVSIRCVPVALNAGEERFLDEVELFVASGPDILAGAEVHVLRNESRRGLGFFVGAGFYPDFIVWVIRGTEQWVIFVDPKGATHMATRASADKLRLPEQLWEIEARNGLPDVHLDAFLVFGTPETTMDEGWLAGLGRRGTRVVFTSQVNYVERLFRRALAPR